MNALRVGAAVVAGLTISLSAVSCSGSTSVGPAGGGPSSKASRDAGTASSPDNVLAGLRTVINEVNRGDTQDRCPLVASSDEFVDDLSKATATTLTSVNDERVSNDDDHPGRPRCSFVVDKKYTIVLIGGLVDASDGRPTFGLQTRANETSCRAFQVFDASTDFYLRAELFSFDDMTDAVCRTAATAAVRDVSSQLASER